MPIQELLKGIFKCNENAQNLSVCLKELLNDIKEIDNFTFDDEIYTIKKQLSSDLKMLYQLYGLNSANSRYACFYCFFNFDEKIENNKIQDLKIERNLNDINNLIHEKTVDKRKGHILHPIIDFINFDEVIIDKLHMVLRITDQFFDILMTKIISTVFS